MKCILKIIFTIFLLSVTFFSFNLTSYAIDALINKQIEVKDFKLLVLYDCEGFMHYLGTPTKTRHEWDKMPLDNGYYITWVPFQIMNSLYTSENFTDGITYSSDYTVILENKSKITGKISSYPSNGMFAGRECFHGTSDLGEVKIDFNNVNNIRFTKNQKARLKPTTILGKKKSILFLPNNTKMEIYNPVFVMMEQNKNGCYLGEQYPKEIVFETGASKFNVPVKKIAEVHFLKLSSNDDPSKWQYIIVTNSGKKYKGSSPLEYLGVEGVAKIEGYNFRVIVPFLFRYGAMRMVMKD